MSNNRSELGALWRKENDRGEFFTGSVTIDGVKTDIVVFPNTYKEADNHPDYCILKSNKTSAPSTRRDERPPSQRQRDHDRPAARRAESHSRPMDADTDRHPRPVQARPVSPLVPVDESDIPF